MSNTEFVKLLGTEENLSEATTPLALSEMEVAYLLNNSRDSVNKVKPSIYKEACVLIGMTKEQVHEDVELYDDMQLDDNYDCIRLNHFRVLVDEKIKQSRP